MSGYVPFNGGMSRKVEVGPLAVPVREVPLTTGETFQLYDTSGPQGTDPTKGLPPRLAGPLP